MSTASRMWSSRGRASMQADGVAASPAVADPKYAAEVGAVVQATPVLHDNTRALALAELSAKLAESMANADEVLHSVVELVSTFLGDTAVLRLTSDNGALDVVAVHDPDPAVADAMRSALANGAHDLTRLLPDNSVVRDAEPVLLTGDRFVNVILGMPDESRQAFASLGAHAALFCPLRVQGRVIGTLGLWRRGTVRVHSQRDQEFAQEFADRAALAIEYARLVARLQNEIDERKRNEDSLRLSIELLQRAQLKQDHLVETLVNAQEEERRRIAIDVHDDSIQAMAAIGIRLQLLRRHAPTHEMAQRIADVEDTVTESIARLRTLLFHLEGSALEKQGLARTLASSLGETFPETTATQVRNRLTGEPPGHVRMVAYRIVQEALSNVRKHAHASVVSVTLGEKDRGLQVVVQDDGTGFDLEYARERTLPGHIGLRAMEERANITGGWLRVESAPGEGTKVTFWLPQTKSAGLDV